MSNAMTTLAGLADPALCFYARPMLVFVGDSITQLGNDTGFGGEFGKDGPGWVTAMQVNSGRELCM